MKLNLTMSMSAAALFLATTGVLADVTPGCIETYDDCKAVVITSVGLVSTKTCKYNPKAMAPADDAGAVQCKYNVEYDCDGKEKKAVVLSPSRMGCAVLSK